MRMRLQRQYRVVANERGVSTSHSILVHHLDAVRLEGKGSVRINVFVAQCLWSSMPCMHSLFDAECFCIIF